MAHRRSRAGSELRAFFDPRRRQAWAMAVRHGAFGIAPVVVTLVALQAAIAGHVLAVDFEHGPWVAGGQLLAAASPYVGPHAPQVAAGSAFVYPALTAVFSIPFSILPPGLAGLIATVLCMTALLITLRLCGVRDWRIYGVVFLWPAVISGWQTANLTLPLGLGIAAAWRYRHRPVVTGVLVAVLISVKVFVWPLGLWLLVTRRYAALGWAAMCALTLNLAAWSVIGFHQIRAYARLMSAVTKLHDGQSYSILALAHGAGPAIADLTALTAAALAVGTIVVLGRRGQDRRAFAISVAACLLVSPLVWLHYFALLIIPLALARPRLAPIWFVPMMMIFPPSGPQAWQIAAALLIAAALTFVALSPATPPLPSFGGTVRSSPANDGAWRRGDRGSPAWDRLGGVEAEARAQGDRRDRLEIRASS